MSPYVSLCLVVSPYASPNITELGSVEKGEDKGAYLPVRPIQTSLPTAQGVHSPFAVVFATTFCARIVDVCISVLVNRWVNWTDRMRQFIGIGARLRWLVKLPASS